MPNRAAESEAEGAPNGWCAGPGASALGRLFSCGRGVLDGRRVWPGLVVLLLALGCQSSSGPPPAPAPADAADSALSATLHPEFSANRVLSDLKKLDRIGDRATGSKGAARTRSFLRSRLQDLGAQVHEQTSPLQGDAPETESPMARTLVGVLPGDSADVFLLVTHYDSWRGYGDDGVLEDEDPPPDEASAPALLLEIGRALAERPLPYTVWLVFLDGDGHAVTPSDVDTATESPSFPGSDAFVASMAAQGAFARVRVAVYFDRVGAEHLMIARDLRSHRVYREVFWQSARDLGADAVFGAEERPVSVSLGHEAFLRHGMRRAVAVVAADPPVSLRAHESPAAPSACCSAESLRTVGVVSLEALERIASRLDRIDRFSRSPLAPVTPEPSELPGAQGSEEAGDAGPVPANSESATGGASSL